MHRGNVLPIALMAFALVGFLVMVDYSISGGKWPWSTEPKVTNTNTSANVNVAENTNSEANVNATSNTNTTTDVTADWKTYTNSIYNYSIKYPPTYTATNLNTVDVATPEHITFYKGQSRLASTAQITMYSLTNTNKTSLGVDVGGWYDWAVAGFPADDSPAASLSDNKRQEIYGGKTFTVIDFDGGSSWSGSPFYYYVSGTTVYIIIDIRAENNVPRNNVTQVHQMLSTFTLTSPTADPPAGRAGWKTYTNTALGYSVMYPSTYKVVADTDVVRFDNGTDTLFDVNYRLDSVDGSLATWFDTSPTADIALGGRPGKKFVYKYCDAGACGDDTVVYAVQYRNKLLGVEFSGDKKIDSTEQAILDSFTFTK